jgi:tetratricopeptide (TPR) repeat protein
VNPLDAESFAAYRKDHPANLWAAHKYAADMMEEENWAEAIKAADVLIRLVPEDYGADSGYRLKAAALRKAQRLEEEGVVLRTVAEHDASALPVFLRLIETDTGLEDWPEVRVNANRAIALNPFLRAPQQALGDSAAALGDADAAVAAYERVIVIDPGAAAMTHFQLGQLLRSADPARARRHLLDSLALAPRFRAGYRMLLDWPVE